MIPSILAGRRGWMRSAFTIIFLACSVQAASAQQNLFNVPSAEITPSEKVFFQQQFNATRSIQSNSTICYGLGNGFETGLNVFDLGILPDPKAQPGSNTPQFLANLQKGFELNETFNFGLGTQLGQSVPALRSDVRLVNFTYFTCVAELPDERAKLYAGPYFANGTYRGQHGNPFGFMLGYDVPVVKDRFNLMGDFISGKSAISVAVIGGVLQVNEHFQLSIGAQLPSPHSHNSYGGVLELTYVPGK